MVAEQFSVSVNLSRNGAWLLKRFSLDTFRHLPLLFTVKTYFDDLVTRIFLVIVRCIGRF